MITHLGNVTVVVSNLNRALRDIRRHCPINTTTLRGFAWY